MMNGYDMTGAAWMMTGGWVLLALAIVGGAWLIARSMHLGRLAPATPLEILPATLGISQPTVEHTRARMRQRAGVNRKEQLVYVGATPGWLSVPDLDGVEPR